MKAILLLAGTLLLIAACDGGVPSTPTAVVEPTVTWAPSPKPPSEVTVGSPEVLITLDPEEGEAIFPMRVTGRSSSTQKDFQGNDIGYIDFLLEIKNNTPHDITKVNGALSFRDLNNNPIDGESIDIEQPIRAGETIRFTNSFLGNEIVPSRKTLKEIPLGDLRIVLRPFFISYANGIGQEIKYNN